MHDGFGEQIVEQCGRFFACAGSDAQKQVRDLRENALPFGSGRVAEAHRTARRGADAGPGASCAGTGSAARCGAVARRCIAREWKRKRGR